MKSKQGPTRTETYNFAVKNKWREAVWDDIYLRTLSDGPDERRKSLVLYLPGREDLDRQCAIERGFQGANLIGVEMDPKIAIALRKERKLVICADIKDVLLGWPFHSKLGVVMADFCEGIDFFFALDFMRIWSRLNFEKTIFLFNFQRGREKDLPFWREVNELGKEPHRGKLFFNINFEGWKDYMRPRFFSYKSNKGSLIFDSVIFQNILRRGSSPLRVPNQRRWGFPEMSDLDLKANQIRMNFHRMTDLNRQTKRSALLALDGYREHMALEKTRRKITANLATRTRRIKGLK